MVGLEPDFGQFRRSLDLRDDESASLVIPNGLWHSDSEGSQLCLVWRVLTGRAFNFEGLVASVKSMLLPVQGMDIRQLPGGCMSENLHGGAQSYLETSPSADGSQGRSTEQQGARHLGPEKGKQPAILAPEEADGRSGESPYDTLCSKGVLEDDRGVLAAGQVEVQSASAVGETSGLERLHEQAISFFGSGELITVP
ncbi:hypothetical protein Salat_1471900 [Sesamum alatum]|uniref:Uncharacterized protein n=1 Tax=Sesamum alatum TaxID=300844 RepID=A0AAE1YB89_9LAMI|nr:hypothetical protein Salat_1471900 [Sesamum alatum]